MLVSTTGSEVEQLCRDTKKSINGESKIEPASASNTEMTGWTQRSTSLTSVSRGDSVVVLRRLFKDFHPRSKYSVPEQSQCARNTTINSTDEPLKHWLRTSTEPQEPGETRGPPADDITIGTARTTACAKDGIGGHGREREQCSR